MTEKTNHEINNPLHVLSSVLKRVEKKSESDEFNKDLDRVKKSLREIESYVKKLYDL